MDGIGQRALVFPPTCFHHFNTHVTFYVKVETGQSDCRWEAVFAGIVPAQSKLLKAFGGVLVSRSRQSWAAFAEYLLLQHLIRNCEPPQIELLGWHQGLLLRMEWDTRIFTTSCRYFYITIRANLDHEITSNSSDSSEEMQN